MTSTGKRNRLDNHDTTAARGPAVRRGLRLPERVHAHTPGDCRPAQGHQGNRPESPAQIGKVPSPLPYESSTSSEMTTSYSCAVTTLLSTNQHIFNKEKRKKKKKLKEKQVKHATVIFSILF